MGKRGPTGKDPDDIQGHRDPEAGVLTIPERGEIVTVPTPPDGLLPATVDRWTLYWESDVARTAKTVDLFVVERLFRYYDQWERYMSDVEANPMVKGSKGQERDNPLAKRTHELEGRMQELESRLGITPLARMRLGIAIGTARLTAAQVNEMAQRNAAGGTDAVPEVEGWEPA